MKVTLGRNILCVPIKFREIESDVKEGDEALEGREEPKNEVVGIAQLINKHNGRYFTQYDEQLANIFAGEIDLKFWYHFSLFFSLTPLTYVNNVCWCVHAELTLISK